MQKSFYSLKVGGTNMIFCQIKTYRAMILSIKTRNTMPLFKCCFKINRFCRITAEIQHVTAYQYIVIQLQLKDFRNENKSFE